MISSGRGKAGWGERDEKIAEVKSRALSASCEPLAHNWSLVDVVPGVPEDFRGWQLPTFTALAVDAEGAAPSEKPRRTACTTVSADLRRCLQPLIIYPRKEQGLQHLRHEAPLNQVMCFGANIARNLARLYHTVPPREKSIPKRAARLPNLLPVCIVSPAPPSHAISLSMKIMVFSSL